MARRKSLASQLMQAYRDAQKAKAAAAKQAEAERLRQARAEEREAARQAREDARREREQAQAWVRAKKQNERARTEEARKADQIVRDLEKREAARRKAAEQKKKAAAREKTEADRRASQQMREDLRREAADKTADVQEQVERLNSVLTGRATGLHAHRLPVEQAFLSKGIDAMTGHVEAILGQVSYPNGLRGTWRTAFTPESRELVLDVDLPSQVAVPVAMQYRYKGSTPPAVVPQPRKDAETKAMYRDLVARLALRAIDEALAVTPPALVDVVAFNGHVAAKDRATGKAIRPCLVSLRAERNTFEELVLDEPELDPVQTLRYLNAIVSQHPYDLEPVRPVVTFDLAKFKLAPEHDVVAGLDSRPDLLALDPIEFEHLIRRLFEARGLKSWVTQASRDDGIDAVAISEEPLVGGLCIIQAKRTKNVVPAETVRAHAAMVNDKVASKGIVVTTAWFGKASHDFAPRHRLELIDGRHLKALLLEYLDIDALIGLPNLPPGWATRDLT
ncbi:restriction endonuclease [Streptomyces goshikiensis]|uniref:restriction endonuclease n=1 Tax=Streptomyces goshikiensis TaxID=1942 RepID=UPI00367E63EE